MGIGTRYSDFTSASKTAFQNPDVRFININVAEFDACKHAALPLTGDARVTIEELAKPLATIVCEKTTRKNRAVSRTIGKQKLIASMAMRKLRPSRKEK